MSYAGGSASGRGVAVGMSGGVDSTVAALLLKQQGYRVVGITLRLWDDPAATDHRACCAPETAERAKSIAHHLGIPHLVVDLVEAFDRAVVSYFVDEYARGWTPNPCVKCNARLRFASMLHLARRLGLDSVATGHYARLTGDPPRLSRGVDKVKDQSYVLAEVDAGLLEHCIFPLGTMTKSEVRSVAEGAGIGSRVAGESQEICFVPGDDYRAFLRARLGDRPGAVVDREGNPLGRHTGTYNFTIGQRRGLGIGAGGPFQVVAIDAERSEVVVEPRDTAGSGALGLEGVTVHRTVVGGGTSVQVRSQGGATPAHMGGDSVIVLDEPVRGVARGQTAVLYQGEAVVLAGTIAVTQPWPVAAAPEEEHMGPVV